MGRSIQLHEVTYTLQFADAATPTDVGGPGSLHWTARAQGEQLSTGFFAVDDPVTLEFKQRAIDGLDDSDELKEVQVSSKAQAKAKASKR